MMTDSREHLLDSLALKMRRGTRPFWENPNAYRVRFQRWVDFQGQVYQADIEGNRQGLFVPSFHPDMLQLAGDQHIDEPQYFS